MRQLQGQNGFTLAEILLVILILSVLATLSVVVFSGQGERTSKTVDRANIRASYPLARIEYDQGSGNFRSLGELVSRMQDTGAEVQALSGPEGEPPEEGMGVWVDGASKTIVLKAGVCGGTNESGPLQITCD